MVKIGERFKRVNDDTPTKRYILALTGDDVISLVCVQTGVCWATIEVEDSTNITDAEFDRLCGTTKYGFVFEKTRGKA